MFSQFKIGTRLAIAFGTLILLLVTVCGFGVYGSKALARDLATTANVDLVLTRLDGDLNQRAGAIASASRELLIVDSAGAIKRQRQLVTTALAESDDLLLRIEALADPQSDQKVLSSVRESKAAFAKGVARFLAVHEAGNPDETRSVLLIEVRPLQAAYQKSLQELANAIEARADARAKSGAEHASATLWALLSLGILGASLGTAASFAIGRSITVPLAQALQAAERIQAGDLASRIETGARDEIGDLLRAMGSMQQQLLGIIEDVLRSARQVAISSDELASGNAELSTRTERSAGSLQETASAMEQISATVAGSSAKSRQASQVADRARDAVVQGGSAMDKLVETMTRIASSSSRIKDIIAVIDGIAFQTNILALNAAVEAARAGEQGRGFAVVASEVRSLAARAAGAAREIKSLIDDSSNRVADGTATVADVGQRIRGIVDEVMNVGRLIEAVSLASHEQESGMADVKGSVNELDQSTQQNAALVDEIAATASSLKSNARKLVETVEFFRLPQAEFSPGVDARASL